MRTAPYESTDPNELSQSQVKFVRKNRGALQAVPFEGAFTAAVLPEGLYIQQLTEHNLVVKRGEVQQHSGTGKDIAVWEIDQRLVEEMRPICQRRIGTVMPCSEGGRTHVGFENVGEWDGESCLRCKECGARFTKSEVLAYDGQS